MGSKGCDVIAAKSCYVVAEIGAPRMTGREYLGRADVVVREMPNRSYHRQRQIRGGATATQIPRLEIT